MKIAAVIGHSADSPGKYSKFIHQSEYFYNKEAADYLRGVDIYKRPNVGGYKSQMRKLGEQLRPYNYDLIVELHFNAYDNVDNGIGHGVETVSYPGNKKTEAWGKEYCKLIADKYDIHNRGAKISTVGGRGYWFLHYMPAPSLILEPFFGDESEALKFTDECEYAQALMQWFQKIK